jgi:hypothetical protein
MQIRPIVLMALALAILAGCQSYFPNGYGNAGPYSAFPPGGYGPPTGSAGPSTTYQPSRTPPRGQVTTEGPPLKNNYMPSNGQNNVPNPREPGAPPATLGTPDNELGEETIRRPTSSLQKPPARLSGLTDDSEETLAAFGDEGFAPPREIEATGGVDDGDDMPRTAKKQRPNPYKYDKQGYTWLRGTVSRDQGGRWRLKYSEDALENDDPYGGALQLVGDDKIETLIEDDVIYVKGRVDPSAKDAYGRPSYRVESLDFLKPKVK